MLAAYRFLKSTIGICVATCLNIVDHDEKCEYDTMSGKSKRIQCYIFLLSQLLLYLFTAWTTNISKPHQIHIRCVQFNSRVYLFIRVNYYFNPIKRDKAEARICRRNRETLDGNMIVIVCVYMSLARFSHPLVCWCCTRWEALHGVERVEWNHIISHGQNWKLGSAFSSWVLKSELTFIF